MTARILALLAALLLAPASAQALPGLLTQIGHGPLFVVKPAQIVYTGDGSGVLGGFTGNGPDRHFGRLKWSTWNPARARGSGAVWLDNCEPDCARGAFKPYAVTVRAFAPHAGHFTRLTLRYDYKGRSIVDRRGVRKFGTSYGYYIVGTAGA